MPKKKGLSKLSDSSLIQAKSLCLEDPIQAQKQFEFFYSLVGVKKDISGEMTDIEIAELERTIYAKLADHYFQSSQSYLAKRDIGRAYSKINLAERYYDSAGTMPPKGYSLTQKTISDSLDRISNGVSMY
jgi:hypothetical protein